MFANRTFTLLMALLLLTRVSLVPPERIALGERLSPLHCLGFTLTRVGLPFLHASTLQHVLVGPPFGAEKGIRDFYALRVTMVTTRTNR